MTNWKRWYKVVFLFILFHIIYFGGQFLVELPAARGDDSWSGILQVVVVFAMILIFFGGYGWYVEHKVKVGPRFSVPVHIGHLISSVTTGLLLIVVLDLVLQFILQVLHIVPETAQNQAGINRMLELNSMSKFVTLFLVVIVAPVCEETIYRLLLIGPIKTKQVKPTTRHRKRLAVLSWVFFILAHMGQQLYGVIVSPSWNGTVAAITASLTYGVLSFVLVREYYLHGSLARSMVIHMSWNALAAGVLLLN